MSCGERVFSSIPEAHLSLHIHSNKGPRSGYFVRWRSDVWGQHRVVDKLASGEDGFFAGFCLPQPHFFSGPSKLTSIHPLFALRVIIIIIESPPKRVSCETIHLTTPSNRLYEFLQVFFSCPTSSDPVCVLGFVDEPALVWKVGSVVGYENQLRDTPKISDFIISQIQTMIKKELVCPNAISFHLPLLERQLGIERIRSRVGISASSLHEAVQTAPDGATAKRNSEGSASGAGEAEEVVHFVKDHCAGAGSGAASKLRKRPGGPDQGSAAALQEPTTTTTSSLAVGRDKQAILKVQSEKNLGYEKYVL